MLAAISFSTPSFADQNSQSLDNIAADQVNKDNRTGTNASGATVRKDNTVDYFICLLIVVLTGKIARVILALAIFVVGILFFLGKINWSILAVTAIGAGIAFGATGIVIAILPRATQVVDNSSGTAVIKTKTTHQLIAERCPEIA